MQCYLSTNSYVFYEVDKAYKFVLPHSYELSTPQWLVGLGERG